MAWSSGKRTDSGYRQGGVRPREHRAWSPAFAQIRAPRATPTIQSLGNRGEGPTGRDGEHRTFNIEHRTSNVQVVDAESCGPRRFNPASETLSLGGAAHSDPPSRFALRRDKEFALPSACPPTSRVAASAGPPATAATWRQDILEGRRPYQQTARHETSCCLWRFRRDKSFNW